MNGARRILGIVLIGLFFFAPLGRLHGGEDPPGWETGGTLAKLAATDLLTQDSFELVRVLREGFHSLTREGALWQLVAPRLCLVACASVVALALVLMVSPATRRTRARLVLSLIAFGSLPTILNFMATRRWVPEWMNPAPSNWAGGMMIESLVLAAIPLGVTALLVALTQSRHHRAASWAIACWCALALLAAVFGSSRYELGFRSSGGA